MRDLKIQPRDLVADRGLYHQLASVVDLMESVSIWAARRDVNSFIEYVFEVKQQPLHIEWQNLANTHPRISFDAPIEHGKTFQFSQARPLYKLGRNLYETIALVGNTGELPENCLTVLATHIEQNPRLHRVFPALKIAEFKRSKSGYLILTVERDKMTGDRDPSMIAIGVGGSIIGRRLSGLVTDDIQDMSNTWTEHERNKLWTVLESTLLNRLIQDGWHTDIGTPWHVEDARHKLRRLRTYFKAHYDATDNLWPEIYKDPKTKKIYGWPPKRLAEKRATMSQLEFDRQFRCIASSGSLNIFRAEHLDLCKAPVAFPSRALAGECVVTGVDLAIDRREIANETVFFTGVIRRMANGFMKIPLDIRGGHWELTEIIEQFRRILEAFPGHAGFRVENNAAQDYLLQAMGEPKILRGMGWSDLEIGRLSVIPHTTTSQYKMDEKVGVRSMSVDFEQTRWILPCHQGICPDPVQRFIDGLVAFDPLGHTSDYVMAAWLFVEQARRFGAGEDDLWTRYGVG